MIGYLKGTVIGLQPGKRTILTLEVNQIGYDLQVPTRMRQQLPAAGSRCRYLRISRYEKIS